MAFANASMLVETSTTTGTGSYVLGGVPSAEYRTINAGIGTGNQGCFRAWMGTTWEEFYGTSSNSTTLTRDTIIRTSTGGTSPINWGAGTKTIECVYSGEKAVFRDKTPVFAADIDLDGNKVILDPDADTYWQSSTDDTPILTAGGAEVLRATTGALRITSADAGSGQGPMLDLYRNSASPADDDSAGHIDFSANSDATKRTFARVLTSLNDITDGTEDSTLRFLTMVAGSLAGRLFIGEHIYSQNSASILAGKTAPDATAAGAELRASGVVVGVASAQAPAIFNRLSDDGTLVRLQQAGTDEGSISVSGTTITYNTFLGAHWSQWAKKGMQPPPLYSVLVMCQERCGWNEPVYLERIEARPVLDATRVGDGEPPEFAVEHHVVGLRQVGTAYREDPKLPKCDVSRERGAATIYGVFGGLDEDGDVTVWALGTAPAVLVKGRVRQGYPLWSSDEPGVAEQAPDDAPWWRCLGRASITDDGEGVRPLPFLAKAG